MPAQGHAPHLLYVAWTFPPCRASGVYRALATANAFARQGYRVTVLTAAHDTFVRFTGADYSLEKLVDPRISIVRVPFDWPALETDLRRWDLTRVLAPKLWSKRRLKRDLAVFPESGYGPWKPAIEATATEIHLSDPIDLVVATANPNVDFAVPAHLHRTAGVPYVIDYRDAWMLDVFDGGLLHDEDSVVARLERDLVGSAREIWFVNEPIREWHQKRYPESADRMHVVANGFDPETAPHPSLTAPPADRPLKFGYIGTVSGKVPLSEFAEGWVHARERSAEMRRATAEIWGYLGFFGAPARGMAAIMDEHQENGLVYAGPVPKRRVGQIYDSFDAVLLILGSGLYVTSGKVFECAASALPIVSVHDPRNAVRGVLTGYPLWFPISDLSPESISTALIDAATAAREASDEVRQQCRDFAAKFSRDLQLEPRVRELAAGLGFEPAATIGQEAL